MKQLKQFALRNGIEVIAYLLQFCISIIFFNRQATSMDYNTKFVFHVHVIQLYLAILEMSCIATEISISESSDTFYFLKVAIHFIF